jgi:hypothetical protein
VEEDPRYGCFYMIHNKAMVSQEMLSCFTKAWERLETRGGGADRAFDEAMDRCVEITRSLFIGTMSAVKHCAKRAVGLYPGSRLHDRLEELRSRNRYIVLKGIMRESAALDLMPSGQEEEWMDLMLLRNLAVHNNSISDTDGHVKVGTTEMDLVSGQMMRGDLDTFILLGHRSMELYHAWICRLDLDSQIM